MISIWIKILYTLFVCVFVPAYWIELTPVNFLWASDLALLVTVPALWLENRLLVSMMAVAVLIPEMLWILDFFARLIGGVDTIPMAGTRYMFDTNTVPHYIRTLSLFHIFLPVVLLWAVYRLGYDHRAFIMQTFLAWIVLPISYWLSPVEKNVNWVYGFGAEPQTWMPQPLFVVFLMVLIPTVFYVPAHFILKRFFTKGDSYR